MKRSYWNLTVQTVLLALTAACLLFALLHNEQAILSSPLPASFSGEYSQNGGPWQPLTDGTELSALDGDLVLRGHFDSEIPEGTRVNFYTNHIGYSVYVNGGFWAENTVMELEEMGLGLRRVPSACGRQWAYWSAPSITPEDEIEIRLHNPHTHGNKSAYRDFLNTLCLTPNLSDVLDKTLEPYSRPLKTMGWAIILAAVMILGAAIASAVMGISVAGVLWKFGLLSVFAGGFFIFDTINFSFLKGLLVFNTYGRQLCMMLFAFWMGLCAMDALTGRRKQTVRVALTLSALLDAVLLTLSLLGVMLIYDTGFYWAIAQVVLCLLLLVCCGWELRGKPKGSRGFLLSCCLLCLTLLLDLSGVGANIYTQGTCTKFVFLFLFVYHVTRTLTDAVLDHQAAIRAEKLEAELEDSRVAIMLSQIQPHFLYNSLTSIYQLCEVDPPAAQRAIGYFSKYLRRNMASLSERRPVPFEEELRHVESYLNLEKLRYGDKLQVVYDILTSDFTVPALTVQPLVENAVKHGVGKKREGGRVTIATRETPESYVITVSDTGTGFDPTVPKEDGRPHVGLKNVRKRLTSMCGGKLDITSAPGQGTTAVITIPKGDKTT